MPELEYYSHKRHEKEFRDMLENMRKELRQGMQQRIAQKRNELGVKEIGDAFDSASEGRDQELGYLLNTRDRTKLLQIEDALRRLDRGEYGICEETGDPIGLQRLRAMPFTRLSVQAQEALEESEKLARERETEEDERQYFELAEEEFAEEEVETEE